MNTVNWHTLTDAGRTMLLDAAINGEVQISTLKEWVCGAGAETGAVAATERRHVSL